MSAQRDERPTPLIFFYVLYFMGVGVSLPFLPGYFKTLGFNGAETGVLLSVGPTLAMVMPPLWGQWADRSGRGGRVLLLVVWGSVAGLFLLWKATSFAEVLVGLAVHTAFASSITPLTDSLALHHIRSRGGTYANIRRWGSLGFILTAFPFGFFVKDINHWTVLTPLVSLAAAGVLCAATLARAPLAVRTGPRASWRGAFDILKQREMAVFLIATSLHWMACAPYHGSLAPHITALGYPASLIGVSSSLGVVSEVVVMMTWARWGPRFSAKTLLYACFGFSAVRWALMALFSEPWILVGASLLHGFTFGAFYLASIEWVTQRTPDSLRATAQTLYAAVTFGVGGVVGYRGAGVLYDVLGGHQLFGVAAVVALFPMAALSFAQRKSQLIERTVQPRLP